MNVDGQAAVRLEGVSFDYGAGRNGNGPQPLFSGFHLAVNGCTAVMGGSGSGKSTLAQLLANDLVADSGNIRWNDDFRFAHDVVYVDQSPLNSVFPWLTVAENVRWPIASLARTRFEDCAGDGLPWRQVFRWLGCARRSRREALALAADQSDHFLKLFRLEHRAAAYPAQISGGELARLALARCLSWRPRFVIIDESLSQLDRVTKHIVYDAMTRISIEHGTTFLIITHILSDAMALAHRCLVLGERPVKILGDFPIALPYPRNEDSAEYRAAQEPLLEVLRRGII